MENSLFVQLKESIANTKAIMDSRSEWQDYAIGIEDVIYIEGVVTYEQRDEIQQLLNDISESY